MARNYFLDVNVVLDMVVGAGGRPKTPGDLVSRAPMGRMAADALQGGMVIDTSTHVLRLTQAKLVENYGFSAEEAVAATQAFRLLVTRSGGKIAVSAEAAPLVPAVQQAVPARLHSRPGPRKTGVDHEDFTMLAGALVTDSDVVVTRDGAVLNALMDFHGKFGVGIVRPQDLAARRVI